MENGWETRLVWWRLSSCLGAMAASDLEMTQRSFVWAFCDGEQQRKAYIMTTGGVFGLITIAHILRIIEEGPHLLTRTGVDRPDHCRGRHVGLGLAPAVEFGAYLINPSM